MGTLLLIIGVLLLVGAIPTWPHSRRWGYGPSGGLALLLPIILFVNPFNRHAMAQRPACPNPQA